MWEWEVLNFSTLNKKRVSYVSHKHFLIASENQEHEVEKEEEGERRVLFTAFFILYFTPFVQLQEDRLHAVIFSFWISICRERPAVMRRHYGYEPNSMQNSSSWVLESKDMPVKSYW